MRKALIVMLLSLFLTGSAMAGDFYVGAGAVYADTGEKFKFDRVRDGDDQHRDLTPASLKLESSTTGGKLFVGWRVHPRLALELSYAKLGNMDFDFNHTEGGSYVHRVDTLPDGTEETRSRVFGTEHSSIKDMYSVGIHLLADTSPFLFENKVGLLGKVGYVHMDWKAKGMYEYDTHHVYSDGRESTITHEDVPVLTLSNTDYKTQDEVWSYGAGIYSNVTDNITIRLEFERWVDILDDADFDTYQLNVLYRF